MAIFSRGWGWFNYCPAPVARLPRLDVPVLVQLERALRFASKEAVLRDVARAEQVAAEIDPERTYPEEWVMFRLSGFRPGDDAPTGVVTGEALLMDLSAWAERLCAHARVTMDDLRGRPSVGVAELCRRWSMARRTLERHRRLGLVARRIDSSGVRGRASLVFMADVVESYERRRGAMIARARAYSRLSGREREAVVRRAKAYRARLGWSISRAAGRIAGQRGRDAGAVRALLQRELAPDRAGVVGEARRAALARLWGRGVGLSRLATMAGRSVAGTRRAVLLARLEAMLDPRVAAELETPKAGAGAARDASVLEDPRARSGLGGRGESDLAALVASALDEPALPARDERVLLLAYHELRERARGAIAGCDRWHPGSAEVDGCETLLRWAARVKAELVRPLLRVVVQTIESRRGVAAGSLRAGELAMLVHAGIRGACDAVNAAGAARGARLAGAASLAVDRAVRGAMVGAGPPAPARRATPRLLPGVAFADWTRRVARWQRFLEPHEGVARAAREGLIDADDAALLRARFALGDGPPKTLAELARERSMSLNALARREHRAIARAIVAARGGGAATAMLREAGPPPTGA